MFKWIFFSLFLFIYFIFYSSTVYSSSPQFIPSKGICESNFIDHLAHSGRYLFKVSSNIDSHKEVLLSKPFQSLETLIDVLESHPKR
jgi:hypothetical protein